MFQPKNHRIAKPVDQEKMQITVTERGPYLVYGRPPLAMQYIMQDDNNESWYFQEGRHFSTEAEPTALCRCGRSRRRPYCDGSHLHAEWDPRLTVPTTSASEEVKILEGATIDLRDEPRLCVFARFCHPAGGVWHLLKRSDDPEQRRLAIREASMCPSGRLVARDKNTAQPFEFSFEPSLGLIEDDAIGSSGGLWVRGAIPVRQETGALYAVRNRTVLCRCGHSTRKPYCDGTHAVAKWQDLVSGVPEGETLPEKVY